MSKSRVAASRTLMLTGVTVSGGGFIFCSAALCRTLRLTGVTVMPEPALKKWLEEALK